VESPGAAHRYYDHIRVSGQKPLSFLRVSGVDEKAIARNKKAEPTIAKILFFNLISKISFCLHKTAVCSS